MDSRAYIHDEYDSRGDISPEVVSQELDNVIQSYDTNDAVYIHDNHDRPAEIGNGNVRDEEVKIKKKRKKEMQIEKEERPLTEEIQTDVAALASFPPMDWKRTSKDYIKIVFTFILVLIFALNVSLFRRFRGNPLFNHTRGEISRKYPLGITPIREIFTFIWPIIYAFQGIWMGLCIASIVIKTRKIKYVDGMKQMEFTYLCTQPNVFPLPMLILYTIGQLAITAYKFINDREYLMLSFILLFVSSAFFHLSLASAVKGLHDSNSFLTIENVEMRYTSLLKAYKLLLYLFYTNGIAIIATWQLVAFSLSLTKYLIHGSDVILRTEAAYSIAYCIIIFYAIFFFVTDVFVANQATRSIYTTYGALLTASVGSLVRILMTPAGNRSQVTLVEVFFAAIVVAAVTLVKAVAIIVRTVKERRRKDKDIDTFVRNGLTTL